MITLKTKETKTKSVNANVKIKKKSKLKNVLKGLTVFSLITAGTIFYFYNTQVVPKVKEINITIQQNRDYLSNINNSIFESSYTDENFNQDFALFDKISKAMVKAKRKDDKYNKYALELYSRIVYLHTLNPKFGYDEIYNRVVTIPASIIDAVKLPEGPEREKALEKIYLNNDFMNNNFGKYAAVTPFMIKEGFWMPTNVGYNNIIKSFNDRYNKDSYIESFLINNSNKKSEETLYFKQREKRDAINESIEKAYNEKDLNKLKLYFKQNREFFQYISGLNIGHNEFSPLSPNAIQENNFISVVRFSMIYRALKDQNKDDVVENMGLF